MSSQDGLVVITGTSAGIGRACAVRLARSGYRVLGLARRDVTADELGVDGRAYSHVSFDLGQIDAIPDLVAELVRSHGKPYGLVNNAAIGTDGILPTMHNADIEELVRLNVTSPIVLTKYVVRHMLTERTGRVVNVSSIVAHTGYRGLAVYGATKAAIEGFTRSLARDVGARNVTVNAVAPGFAATAMNTSLTPADVDRIKRRSPLGRFVELDEVAGAVEYLLGPNATGVTGTILTVDAGSTA